MSHEVISCEDRGFFFEDFGYLWNYTTKKSMTAMTTHNQCIHFSLKFFFMSKVIE